MTAVVALASFVLVFAAGFRWFRLANAVQVPADRTGFVVVMAAGALLGATALVLGPGDWLSGAAAGLALTAGSFFLVLVGISAQKGGTGRFQVGSPVPDFHAPDENGDDFALASLAGRPFLLKFFRGHW